MTNDPKRRARILVVDDEVNLAEGIRENLEAEGHAVELAEDGVTALSMVREGGYDLVVLDVMMPGLDGFAVCESVRASGIDVPILFLTAKGAVADRIRGLEAGGDDYLAKPFRLRELLLRVDAILRRGRWYASPPAAGTVVRFGGHEVDFRTYHARCRDASEHTLTQKEAMILKLMVEREGEVVPRRTILDRVWGHETFPSTRTVDNFIVRLRKRFEPDPERPAHFHTVRGVGYRFTKEADRSE